MRPSSENLGILSRSISLFCFLCSSKSLLISFGLHTCIYDSTKKSLFRLGSSTSLPEGLRLFSEWFEGDRVICGDSYALSCA